MHEDSWASEEAPACARRQFAFRYALIRMTPAIQIMLAFADRSGLTGQGPERRYLWTDAFAVCNLLGLARLTGEERYTGLALQLVERVHPTLGGLRIGKELPERRPEEPFDEHLEWERDGQYFHYLTKWIHALDQVRRSSGSAVHGAWARELAVAAHGAFTHRAGGRARLHWKMSIDLSRPLVPSMGQHDPLDGYVTCLQLRAPELATRIAEFRSMIVDPAELATADPLGIGGLLVDALRLQQLEQQGAPVDERLAAATLAAACAGLEHWVLRGDLSRPAGERLGFRELGLAIGLRAVELMVPRLAEAASGFAGGSAARRSVEALQRHLPLGERIESFWLDRRHQASPTWIEHRDINEVMLATSRAPEGFLVLRGEG